MPAAWAPSQPRWSLWYCSVPGERVPTMLPLGFRPSLLPSVHDEGFRGKQESQVSPCSTADQARHAGGTQALT